MINQLLDPLSVGPTWLANRPKATSNRSYRQGLGLQPSPLDQLYHRPASAEGHPLSDFVKNAAIGNSYKSWGDPEPFDTLR